MTGSIATSTNLLMNYITVSVSFHNKPYNIGIGGSLFYTVLYFMLQVMIFAKFLDTHICVGWPISHKKYINRYFISNSAHAPALANLFLQHAFNT